ncbi:hypothetical protein NADFUDRAFT_50078 [Nadsonia fulvescens var. elongata DSM 6958]|uniref:RNase T2-like C-terminal domain-containing protein n=1 Tax=Nadsonia fulvescens var. elongata DSM 6958 TaxID=857566 RepID=A0A1E3PQE9_9ASCO|nr:hypothetical protein NADFUDRAFT_50078 [Nadsonia fulvescens var. elongata DSM 6958]
MSTIKPKCYDAGANQHQYLIDCYTTAIALWKGLPTYQWLEEAGIVLSNDKTHILAEFQSALESKFNDMSLRLGCTNTDGSRFTGETCATYTMAKGEAESLPHSPCSPVDWSIIPITLASSKSNCDIIDGAFSCVTSNKAGQFLFDVDINCIIYDNNYNRSAESVPSKNQKIKVSSGEAGAVDFHIKFVPK